MNPKTRQFIRDSVEKAIVDSLGIDVTDEIIDEIIIQNAPDFGELSSEEYEERSGVYIGPIGLPSCVMCYFYRLKDNPFKYSKKEGKTWLFFCNEKCYDEYHEES